MRRLLHDDAEAVQGIALRNPDEGRNGVFTRGQLRGHVRPVSEPVGLELDRSVPFAPLVGHEDTNIAHPLQMIPRPIRSAETLNESSFFPP